MKLIDKDVLVAEIEERRDSLISLSESCPANTAAKSGFYAQAQTLEGIKNFINTLEVKGVDYERELSKYISNGIHRFFPNVDDDYCKMDSVIWQDYVIETAKHFFELGLKAKGE